MAFAILSKDKCLSMVSPSNDDLDAVTASRGTLEAGICGFKVTISDADYNGLRFREKKFISYDGSTVVLEDLSWSYQNEAELIDDIKHRREKIKARKDHNETSSSFKTRLEAMDTALANIDTSSITYPLNKSVEKYLSDQGTADVISDLQY